MVMQDIEKNSFNAVVELKTETYTDDEFLIYKINKDKCNGGHDSVFKGTKTMTMIAIQMDRRIHYRMNTPILMLLTSNV